MNGDEIRELAISRAATAIQQGMIWPSVEQCVPMAAAVVDALGDLLPTAIEKRLLDDGSAGFTLTEDGSCEWFATAGTQQRRYVTKWRAVDDEG